MDIQNSCSSAKFGSFGAQGIEKDILLPIRVQYQSSIDPPVCARPSI